MGRRWGSEDPPPEAYGRVTDPERYAPVAAEVDRIVRDLEQAYDVRVDPAASWPLPLDERGVRVERVVRLDPVEGAPLVLAVTGFPGVLGWSGAWSGDGLFPACGCDACDETVEDLLEGLHGFVASVVGGGFTERLSLRPRELATRRTWPGGGSGGGDALDEERLDALAALAPPGRLAWPPWPARTGAATGTTT